MADVFISYAREDQAVARRVAASLQSAGFEVWWDADLPAHRAYSEEIERNLAQAKAVIVLWSKTAAKSQWVRAEADVARNAGKLIQAQIDGSIPPLPFNQIQCADLKGWRGSASHSGWAKLRASVEELAATGSASPTAGAAPRLRQSSSWRRVWIAAAVLFALGAAAGLFLLLRAPGEHRKPVVAVLPFTSLDARDASLVAGMWEDTRQAIGRNPQLVVLGPNSAQELAKKGASASKHAADYLLQASIRTAGDRIRVSTDLVRAKDGTQLWSQNFDRKLDDVFALQSEIAGEIEGRIRGRLAEKGGVKPEHIATSGEVYALYSDARAKFRRRESSSYPAALGQLQQVVRMDPNFAPGWATLSQVSAMLLPSQRSSEAAHGAVGYARKAIDLAPNLADGHAALAYALYLRGPVARAELERAIELDPNDYQAYSWLGVVRSEAGDKSGALDAFSRAVEVEPLFWPAVLNKLEILQGLGDEPGIQALLDKEKRLGAGYFAVSIEIKRAIAKGDIGRAANMALTTWKSGGPEARTLIGLDLWALLLQLGFMDEAAHMGPVPDFAPYLWRNDPKGLEMIEAHQIGAESFFGIHPLVENAGRVYILNGRSRELAEKYLSLRLSPDQFKRLTGVSTDFLYVAPLVAVALKQAGYDAQAQELLRAAEATAKSGSGTPENAALLARVYAAQGRKEEALRLLASAVNRHWLPLPPLLLTDLTLDPPLSSLKSDPRFESIRQQILATIQRQRAQVRIADLN